MSFHLDDPLAWKPFNYKNALFETLPSIQPAILEYKPLNEKWLQELEQAVEKCIVASFEGWRKGNVTRWNRLCSRSFKTLLSKFEEEIVAGIDLSASIQQSKELDSICKVYKLTGHPISMPYTDGAALCNALFHRDIHSNVTSGVEFALGVHCYGYPGQFVNVHVFVASLVR
ncbi:Protein cc2d2b, partial [Kappamyces sp. JEL0680]